MVIKMDFQLFDNFEDDGQLSMFDLGEDIEDLQAPMGTPMGEPTDEPTGSPMPISAEQASAPTAEQLPASGSAGVRIRTCSTCGKMLTVREENGYYTASCNACGIRYIQREK